MNDLTVHLRKIDHRRIRLDRPLKIVLVSIKCTVQAAVALLATVGAWLVWAAGYGAARAVMGTLAAVLWTLTTVKLGWNDGRKAATAARKRGDHGSS